MAIQAFPQVKNDKDLHQWMPTPEQRDEQSRGKIPDLLVEKVLTETDDKPCAIPRLRMEFRKPGGDPPYKAFTGYRYGCRPPYLAPTPHIVLVTLDLSANEVRDLGWRIGFRRPYARSPYRKPCGMEKSQTSSRSLPPHAPLDQEDCPKKGFLLICVGNLNGSLDSTALHMHGLSY